MWTEEVRGASGGLANGAGEVVWVGKARAVCDFLNPEFRFLKQPDGLTDAKIVKVLGGSEGKLASENPEEGAAVDSKLSSDALDGERGIGEVVVHALLATESKRVRIVVSGVPCDDGEKNGVSEVGGGAIPLGGAGAESAGGRFKKMLGTES